jgi:hypothetical protein
MRVDVVLASWSRPPGPRGRGQLAVAGRCERATQRRAPGPEGARPRALLSTPYLPEPRAWLVPIPDTALECRESDTIKSVNRIAVGVAIEQHT